MKINFSVLTCLVVITIFVSCSSLNKCAEYDVKTDIAELVLAPIFVPIGFITPIIFPDSYAYKELSAIPGFFCFLPFYTLNFTHSCDIPLSNYEENTDSGSDGSDEDYQPPFVD